MQKVLTYQFKFLLLFVLQFLNVLGEVWSVKLVVQPALDLQHFLRDAAERLRYLMDQLPVVVKVIMGPCPQVGFVSPGKHSAAITKTTRGGRAISHLIQIPLVCVHDVITGDRTVCV